MAESKKPAKKAAAKKKVAAKKKAPAKKKAEAGKTAPGTAASERSCSCKDCGGTGWITVQLPWDPSARQACPNSKVA